jgi:DNA-binding helix-hairpin-helix protein with protein kinase domain
VVAAVAVVSFTLISACAIGLAPVAVAALLCFLIFAVWWVVLEVLRRGEMHQVNREYEAEVAALEARADQQHEQAMQSWRRMLAAYDGEVARRRQAKAGAEQRLRAAEDGWLTTATRSADAFQRKKEDLRKLRQRHEELAGDYALARQRLQMKAREMQLAAFLQQYFISDASIRDIGPTRTATLRSFGIETAFDVEPIAVLQVPGFGEKLTERLVQWRQQVEAKFAFNPAAGVPPAEQKALEVKYATARQPVEAQLLAGEGDLRAIVTRTESELRQLYEQVRSCLRLLAQAEVDLRLFPPEG